MIPASLKPLGYKTKPFSFCFQTLHANGFKGVENKPSASQSEMQGKVEMSHFKWIVPSSTVNLFVNYFSKKQTTSISLGDRIFCVARKKA